ncbi:HAD family hydrolase [Oceanidesulfovibrio marinus]|uniref:phosphoglycolate phosphatase n=1 Tax=Oceanidesulfovibrio marinus TaxID=370038 RepID=A0A6P1ZEH3_9BACT|nr:HAD family hydrolase [Oceanidesulfovibrio marinus]TVM33025.1 HAD family hydrolase [Oceanidesulfovibrio marinus]
MHYEPTPTLKPHAVLSGLEAVVFDFDGTLAELILDFAEMRRLVARTAAPFLSAEPAPGSTPVLEWLATLAAEAETLAVGSGAALTESALAAIEAMEVESAARGILFPFTRPLLDDLRKRGLACGIITRNCSKAVRTVFPDVDEHLEVVLTRDDVPRPKPHPAHLLDAIRRMGVDSRATLMVGDHPMDMETARAAGTRAGGVASGRITLDALSASGADIVAPDCAALFKPLLAPR